MSKTILHIGGIPLSIGKIPICLDYTPPIDYGPLLLQFVTNDVGGSSFDPSVATSSGTLWWDLGDGSILNSNKFTHVYSLSGNKTVKVYQGSTTGSVGILEIGIDNDKIVGVLDLSTLSNLGGVFDANTNPDLMQIKNPISSQIYGNKNLQTIIFPTTLNRHFFQINCVSCSLDTTTVDNILDKLATRWNQVLPNYTTAIWLDKYRNSPPTDGSSNANIAKILNIFSSSTAYDVSVLINYGPTQLLKFDGSVFLKSNTSLAPPSASDYRISFDCYMDTSTNIGTGTSVMIVLGGTNNMGVRFISDTSIQYYYGSTVKQCPIFLPNQKNHIDFYYNGASAAGDVSLYINGAIQSKVNAGTGSSRGSTWIGGWDSVSWTNIKNFTLWNLDLNGEHFYKGDPSGNIETAWKDTIGTIDLSLIYPDGKPPSKRYAVVGQVGLAG